MTLRLTRAWAFGRHVPPRKLFRRLALTARHRLRDRLGAFIPPEPNVMLRDTLPGPLFAPRRGALRQEDADLVFSFVGREMVFANGQIDWTAPGPGAENQLWRMNLAYMEYLEEVDDAQFVDLVGQWLSCNEPVHPGAWRDGWNSYALSIRVVVWMQQLALRRRCVDTDLVEEMSASVARQVAYLVRHLETDIGGNHLVKNIKALIWASAAFKGPVAQSWQVLGRMLLERELTVQILPDGVHYERSPAYHAQVFADLIEIRAALHRPKPALDNALNRMAQATADLAHPDGRCAQFNDAGLTMAYSPGACLDAFVAQGFARPEPRRHFAFPDGGYFGWRDDRLTLIADCGPIAPDDLPAHGHGDVLSFEVSVDGRRVIVDQGVFEYVAGARRDLSRTSLTHNTLALKGADQADFFGAFRVGHRPKVTVLDWHEGALGIGLTGCHDGFARLPGAPLHVRQIEAGSRGVVLRDWLEGTTDRRARAGVLLHPAVTAERIDERTFSLVLESGAALQLSTNSPLSAEPGVWWPDMGVEHKTIRLVAKMTDDSGEIEMRISFAEAA